MGNALEFILKLTDQLSPAMRQAASVADSAAARIQADMDRAGGASKIFSHSLQQLKDRLDNINRTRLTTHIPDVFRTATKEAEKLERQIERLENTGKKPGGMGLGGLLGTAAIIAGGRDVIRTGVDQQSIARAINFTTGGHGAEATRFISSESERLGLNEEAQLQGFKTLSGGLRGLNFDLQKQLDIIGGVNAGISTYNLQGEESKRVYLALGQIASKGTVQAEELRGQIGEIIPGAFSIAAKAMGRTETELNKLLDKGEVMSKDFLPRFAAQMQKEFGKSAIDASTGAAANINRFDNTLLHLKTTIATDLLPVAIKFLNALRKGLEWVGNNKDIVYPLVAGIGSVVLITQGWALAQGIVNAVMAVNPVMLLIGAVIALGLWIYNLTKKYEGWGSSMKAIWNIIKEFVHLHKLAFQSLGETIWYWIQFAWLKVSGFVQWIGGAIGNVFNSIQALIKLDFKGAKDALFKEIVTPASLELEKLQQKHAASQQAYKQDALNSIKNIADNYGKIGLTKKASTGKDPVTENSAGSSYSNTNLAGIGVKADNINGGGLRSITINIGKQIEKLEVHTLTAREGIEEMGQIIREELRRVLYSANGMATN